MVKNEDGGIKNHHFDGKKMKMGGDIIICGEGIFFTFCSQKTIFPYELNHKNTQNRFKNIVISLEISKKMSF